MTNSEDMVLYEVITPEKLAAMIGGKTIAPDQPPEAPADETPEAPAPEPRDAVEEAQAEPRDAAEAGPQDPAQAAQDAAEDAAQDVAEAEAVETPAPQVDLLDIPEPPPARTVIDVRFREGGKTYYFDPGTAQVREGDGVIVETVRGVEFGDVAWGVHTVSPMQVVGELKKILRVASQQDREQREKNRAKEKEAYGVCARKIQEHGLDMKLVDVECAFNGAKIVFYFTADGRVDFRELVKDLAGVFKTRIELRQIGVRDEAKMLGGLGSCGRPVCCKQFLPDFQPVSIKMAKEQSLSLSPTKISGICGRLMCCLKYEQDTYEAMRKRMPKVGKEVMSPDGQGTVMENNIITEKTRLKMVLPDGTIDVRWYPFAELTLTDAPRLEPIQRPPRVERLSHRERVLQEQKARKEAAAAAALAQSEAPAPEAQAEGDPAKRKRRRNRRRRPKPDGQPNGENA